MGIVFAEPVQYADVRDVNPLPKEGQGGCPAHASIIPLTRVGILVKITNWAREVGDRLRIKLIYSSSGDSGIAYFRISTKVNSLHNNYRGSNSKLDEDRERYLANRAASVVRRRIRLMGGRVLFLTFTAGGRRITSWMEARRLMSGFVRLLRDRGLEHLLSSSYVGVIEEHTGRRRGGSSGGVVAYHLHFVCGRGRYTQAELELLRQVWTGYLLSEGYELSAGTRCHRVHVAVWSSRRAALYAAKYVTKGFIEIGSRGCDRVLGQDHEIVSRGYDRVAGVSRYIASRDMRDRVEVVDLDTFLRLLDCALMVEGYELPDLGIVVGYLYFDTS